MATKKSTKKTKGLQKPKKLQPTKTLSTVSDVMKTLGNALQTAARG